MTDPVVAMFQELANPLLMGVLLGGLYALVGIGLSLVFGTMRLVNLAHGDLMIFSSYVSLVLFNLVNLDPMLSIVLTFPLLFAVGFGIQRYLMNRVQRLGMEPPLLIAFGISILVQNVLLLVFKADYRGVMTSYSLNSYDIGGFLQVPLVYVLDFAAALVVMILLYQFLRRTYLGRAIRAITDDAGAAGLMGINTSRVYAYAFGMAMGIAAVAGALVSMTFIFAPATGSQYLIIAFGVVIIGGLGSIRGTFVGGIIMGLAQILSAHFLGPGYQLLVGYLVLFIVLAVRPQGIFGTTG
jgi:branched-chain amino acid transport system permease protein